MPLPFREISDEQLADWLADDPERVVRYVHRARLAGNDEAAWRASTILIDSYKPLIWGWCDRKMPRFEVDEAADGAYVKVIKALRDNPPEMVNQAQLRGWVRSIVYKHCAGLYRDGREEARRKSKSIDWAYEDGNPASDKYLETEEVGFDFVEHKEIVERNFAELNEEHQLVITYSVYNDLQSNDVCEILLEEHGLEYKANNIDQIAGRFRKKCLGDVGEL